MKHDDNQFRIIVNRASPMHGDRMLVVFHTKAPTVAYPVAVKGMSWQKQDDLIHAAGLELKLRMIQEIMDAKIENLFEGMTDAGPDTPPLGDQT